MYVRDLGALLLPFVVGIFTYVPATIPGALSQNLLRGSRKSDDEASSAEGVAII